MSVRDHKERYRQQKTQRQKTGSVAEMVDIGRILGKPPAGISRAVTSATSAIDRVHRVPELVHRTPVVSDSAMLEGGKYRWEQATGAPLDIRINPKGDHLELTTVLEIGHLLDHQAIGKIGEFASIAHPNLNELRRAIDSTGSVQKLEDLRAAGSIPVMVWMARFGRCVSDAWPSICCNQRNSFRAAR